MATMSNDDAKVEELKEQLIAEERQVRALLEEENLELLARQTKHIGQIRRGRMLQDGLFCIVGLLLISSGLLLIVLTENNGGIPGLLACAIGLGTIYLTITQTP